MTRIDQQRPNPLPDRPRPDSAKEKTSKSFDDFLVGDGEDETGGADSRPTKDSTDQKRAPLGLRRGPIGMTSNQFRSSAGSSGPSAGLGSGSDFGFSVGGGADETSSRAESISSRSSSYDSGAPSSRDPLSAGSSAVRDGSSSAASAGSARESAQRAGNDVERAEENRRESDAGAQAAESAKNASKTEPAQATTTKATQGIPQQDLKTVMSKMVEAFRVGQNGTGSTEVQMDLKGSVMGGMGIRMSSGPMGLEAVFEVGQYATRNALEAQMSDLIRRLESQGLKVNEVRVEVQDSEPFRQSGGGAQGDSQSNPDEDPYADPSVDSLADPSQDPYYDPRSGRYASSDPTVGPDSTRNPSGPTASRSRGGRTDYSL